MIGTDRRLTEVTDWDLNVSWPGSAAATPSANAACIRASRGDARHSLMMSGFGWSSSILIKMH